MTLFHKRPLALICICFLIGMFLGSFPTGTLLRVCLAAVLLLIAVAIGIVLLRMRRGRWKIGVLLLCVLALLLAAICSGIAFDFTPRKALRYTGDRNVEMNVISEQYRSESASEYEVIIRRIGDDTVKIKALLVYPFSFELMPGDRVQARAELVGMDEPVFGMTGEERTQDRNILLSVVVYEPSDAVAQRDGENGIFRLLTRQDGLAAFCTVLRQRTADWMTEVFGEQTGALARGFFIGDRSALAGETVRDFRRSGISHLLAVSGLHISILLGAAEEILRRLRVPKKFRCAGISLLALLLVALTGFSMSACRAVGMLLAVYLNLMFAEESDAVTSLFAVTAVIVLCIPHAVNDLSLLMSFIATLGLLCFYLPLNRILVRKSFRNRGVQMIWRAGRGILRVMLITLVSNLCLLPVLWRYFGEMSAVSVIVNLVMSPLVVLFLCLIVVCLLVAPVPVVGSAFLWAADCLCNLILLVSRTFSRTGFAVLSLDYGFSSILIPLYAAVLVLCLVVHFRKKLLPYLLPLSVLLCFSVCILVYHAVTPAKLWYEGGEGLETLAISDRGSAVWCDLSCRTHADYETLLNSVAEKGISRGRALILTSFSQGQPRILEAILQKHYVEILYLPEPMEREEEIAVSLAGVSEKLGCKVIFYRNGEIITPTPEIAVAVWRSTDSELCAVGLGNGQSMVTYVVPTGPFPENISGMIARSRGVIVGQKQGDPNRNAELPSAGEEAEWVVFSSHDVYAENSGFGAGAERYIPPENSESFGISFSLN